MAKYPNTKRARARQIVAMRRDEPELSLKEIGKEFDVSRQRIGQILKWAQTAK